MLLFISLAAVAPTTRAGDGSAVVYQIEVVRGTSSDRPEEPGWKPVGPGVAERLSPFRWKHYWEVQRQILTVTPAKPVRAVLVPDRAIELRLLTPDTSEIRLFRKGRLVRKSTQPSAARISIMGGDREEGQCWFVVVRNVTPAR